MKKNVKELGKRGKEAQMAILEFLCWTYEITKIPLVMHQKILKLSKYFLMYTRVLQLKFQIKRIELMC